MKSSNWTTNELRQLKEPTNHSIIWDGYDYYWNHFIDSEWSLHSTKHFEDFNKPFSWLKYWLHKWNAEYTRRQERLVKQLSKATKTRDRITIAKQLKPDAGNTELANYLNVSIKTMQRHKP